MKLVWEENRVEHGWCWATWQEGAPPGPSAQILHYYSLTTLGNTPPWLCQSLHKTHSKALTFSRDLLLFVIKERGGGPLAPHWEVRNMGFAGVLCGGVNGGFGGWNFSSKYGKEVGVGHEKSLRLHHQTYVGSQGLFYFPFMFGYWEFMEKKLRKIIFFNFLLKPVINLN